jgi:protein farnesyltransferase/geranylgeranyltransferase type-1 subunit alpha
MLTFSRLYRAATVKHLAKDPLLELAWLNNISLKHLKNYQIWQHRQMIMSMVPELPNSELPFLARVLAKDAKNYHPWSYRQWLVVHFSLWPTTSLDSPGSTELEFTESLLTSDVRNNSAWNHRFFVNFGGRRHHSVDEPSELDLQSVPAVVWEREIEFAKAKISEAPQNASAWNYLKGVIKKQGSDLGAIKDFALQYADVDKIDEIRSSHALDCLADVWADQKDAARATRALQLLAERFDPIRRNYWKWRIGLIESPA